MSEACSSDVATEALSTYARLLRYARPYRVRLGFGVFFAVISGVSTSGLLISLKPTLEYFFGEGAADMRGFSEWALMLVFPSFMLVMSLCNYLSTILVHGVGFRVVRDLRAEAFERLQHLPFSFFGSSKTGDIISRVSSDTLQVQAVVSRTVSELIREPFVLLGALGTVLYKFFQMDAGNLSWSLLILPACIAPVLFLGRRVRRYSRQNQESFSGLLSVLDENVNGLHVVRAFDMGRYEVAKFNRENDRVFSRLMRVIQVQALNQPLMEVLAAVSIVFAFSLARSVGISLADFLTIAGGLLLSYRPIKRLGRIYMTIQQANAAADRVFELLDEPIEVEDSADSVCFEGAVEGVSLCHVAFDYGEEAVLEDVSLDVAAGQCIALVGSSGSGKTTLANLLPRFFDVKGGAIKINGRDIREYTLSSLRQQMAVVTQETFLFNDTVAANIGYGRADAALEDVKEAARRAYAHGFIEKLPEGYDTVLGDRGFRLSGGQRQRIAIARALFRNAPILILDEATSALDNESEREVQAAINELMRGRTVFAIAHRLTTIQHADCIVVLDKGRIVEEGNHSELLAAGGVYKRLYNLQFESPVEG